MILKAARINAGFSQSQVGLLLHVSKSTVSAGKPEKLRLIIK